MTLKQQLTEDMKDAMRARDSVRLNAIRFLLSDIRNFEIDNGEQDDAGVQKVIAKQVKQMKDAMADFDQAGRADLVEEETAKLKVMEAYLPQQMSDEDLQIIVDRVVSAATDKNMGLLIGQVMKEVVGRADGGRVSQMVRQALQA